MPLGNQEDTGTDCETLAKHQAKLRSSYRSATQDSAATDKRRVQPSDQKDMRFILLRSPNRVKAFQPKGAVRFAHA